MENRINTIGRVGDIWALTTKTTPNSMDHYLLLEHNILYNIKEMEAWDSIHLETGNSDIVYLNERSYWSKVA